MKALVLVAIFAAALTAQIPQVGGAAPQSTLPGNTVVATVAGVSVTLDQVRKMTETAPPQILQYLQKDPPGFIRQMFLFQYLTSEGDKLKLGEQSPLKEQIEAARNWLVANDLVNHELNSYQIGEQQMKDFYQKNQSRWEQARIKAIFIGFKPAIPTVDLKDIQAAAKGALEGAHPANQRSEDEAKKLAGDLVKQLRGGADFGKLVEQYSDDSSSKGSGGEFPAIKATSPYPEDLKKAIFALNNGDISDPIHQPTGFYVVRMDEKTVQPLDDVREPILKELQQSHLNEWINDLNKRFTPAIQSPQFFSQPQLYLQPGAAAPAPPKQ